jgi:hypothetical protein
MRRGALSALLVVALGGCISATSSYLAIPIAHGPLPARGRATFEARGSGLSGLERTATPSASSQWIPEGQFDFGLQIRASRYFGIRAHGSVASPDWARAAGSSAAQRPTNVTTQFGFGMGVRIPIVGERSAIDLTFDNGYAFAPAWHVPPGGGPAAETIETQVILEGGVYATHFEGTWLRVAGGFAVRNHPSLGSAFGGGTDTPFRWGNAIGILAALAEVHATDWLSFSAHLQWPFAGLPFTYFPTLGLGVGATFPGPPGEDFTTPELDTDDENVDELDEFDDDEPEAEPEGSGARALGRPYREP